MRPVDRDAAVRWAGLVELVPAGLPGGTNPIGTTLWEFLSAATKCPVVEVRAEGSTLLVVASMAWSDLARHQVGASPGEVVLGPRIIPDLVRAADRNGGDDSAIEGEIGVGNVDDDGLGHLDQRWIRGGRLRWKCCAATKQRLVARPECQTVGPEVLHQEGTGDRVRRGSMTETPPTVGSLPTYGTEM